MSSRVSAPPRPIAPGDIVVTFSFDLGEWTAAQITALDTAGKLAGVVDLDWSGSEPQSVADLGEVGPLRLTHHSWNGLISHCFHPWVLPRSCRRIGSLPLLVDQPLDRYGGDWLLGFQLARQRQWDNGVREEALSSPQYTGAEFDQILSQDGIRPEVRTLAVSGIESLDCSRLVRQFPGLRQLRLLGDFGSLSAAGAVNELSLLRSVWISDLFGMTSQDVLVPARVPELEWLIVDSVPAEYATAMRRTWRPEIPQGTYVDIRGARKPEWIAENINNPLRAWDDREHISGTVYKNSLAQYKQTRRAIMALLPSADQSHSSRLVEIAREYGEAFNRLDNRSGFIETEEREDLFAALDHIVQEAETASGSDLAWVKEHLVEGVEAVRDW